MLNIMLMRSQEDEIFDQTRTWLAGDRQNHLFHLVVDELHTYRGTPGTEVGYLLRALLERIGLEPDSPQLRIIATSASVQDEPASRNYLEGFFGRSESTFNILSGDKREFPSSGMELTSRVAELSDLDEALDNETLDTAVASFAESVGVVPTQDVGLDMATALERVGAYGPVVRASGRGPFTIGTLAATLFGSEVEGEKAARGLIRGLIHARQPTAVPGEVAAPLPLRVHYFFHNVGRIWACVNPACSGRTGVTPHGSDEPPVGRLFSDPRPQCPDCGRRVLELLYCQPCGEVFLGGYKKEEPPNNWYLSPDYPNLDRVPDRSLSLSRSFGEYLVYWPARGRSLFKQTNPGPRWVWQAGGTTRLSVATRHVGPNSRSPVLSAPGGASARRRDWRLCFLCAHGRGQRLSHKVPSLRVGLGASAG